jgi:hypothetical protein
MARLYPRVDAVRVLKTADALDLVPSALGVVVGLVAFLARLPPLAIGTATFMAHMIGVLPVMTGVGLGAGTVALARLYSSVARSGMLFVLILGLGLALVGGPGVVGFLAGRFVAGLVTYAVEFWNMRRVYAATGVGLTGAELAFLKAYQVHAGELGASTDVTAGDDELQRANWEPVLEDLTRKWPDLARRFTAG